MLYTDGCFQVSRDLACFLQFIPYYICTNRGLEGFESLEGFGMFLATYTFYICHTNLIFGLRSFKGC